MAYPPNETLLELNDAIHAALNDYLNVADGQEGGAGLLQDEGAIRISFELPEVDTPPAEPTVSVFLYDVQEDLQLRHNEVRQFTGGKLQPGVVHVRCCYLITYWDPNASDSSPIAIGPRSQSMVVMNKVLNALVNNRSFPGMSVYTRIIPPSEHLNSLGNFWQALGNKPRLSLSYMVTVPIGLRDRNDVQVPLKEGGGETRVTPVS